MQFTFALLAPATVLALVGLGFTAAILLVTAALLAVTYDVGS